MKNIFTSILFCFISAIGFSQLKAYPDTIETFFVPEIAAEFPGGLNKLYKYLTDNFTSKIIIEKDQVDIFKSPYVQWTVDETGKVGEVKIIRSTNVPKIDKLLLDIVESMPLWKPAENEHKKVRQGFKVPVIICFK